jgi:sodium/proline symporter
VTGNTAIILAFTLYLGIMLMIGVGAWRRTADLPDYLLGGRRLGSWVAALSAGASDMSGWLLLGLPGYAYASGMEASWIAIGLLAGTWLNWRFVATPLRRFTARAGNALTLPEYLERRYADHSHVLRIVSAVFILLFFVFYTGAGLAAGGKLFASVFGWPYHWAVIGGVVAIVAYTFLGGFLAVCWTDLVQGLLMLAALLVVPVIAVYDAGGWETASATIRATNPALLNPFSDATGAPLGAIAIASLLGWGLGYFGQPHILARFMAVSSITRIPQARRIGVSWTVLTLLGAVTTGLAGLALIETPLTGADTEKVFIVLVSALMHPVPAGFCLAAILAAIMSTADSQLLVSSSALTEDLYHGIFGHRLKDMSLVWIGRIAVLVIAAVACFLALDPDSKVLELVAYAWAGFGAAFGPVLLLSLYWDRMTRHAALAGIVTGAVTVIVWKQLSGGIFDLYEIVPGFLLSGLVAIAVSRLGPEPTNEVVDKFHRARASADHHE